MKIIRKTQLRFTEGNSDKVYEVDLCELPSAADARFVVNFRYGRYGSNLREGSKTPSPVTQDQATKVFDSIVVAKINKGYKDTQSDASPSSSTRSSTLNKPSGGVASPAIETILGYLDNPPKHWPLSRIIWRAGELGITQAADKIASKIGTNNSPVDYSAAWALGRCGNTSHLPAIEALQHSKDASIKRMANEAYLHLASQDLQSAVYEQLKQQIPEAISDCINSSPNNDSLNEQLESYLKKSDFNNIALLENLYSLALQYPCCHSAILHTLSLDHFASEHYFQAYRHIFKLAEFRLDAPMFAKITRLIEMTPHGYWGEPFREETKNYLRKRSWRTLRKLGEVDNSQYVDMASAILLSITDEDAQEPKTVTRTEWNWQTRQSEVVSVKHFDAYPNLVAFNQILYRNSQQFEPTSRALAWVRIDGNANGGNVQNNNIASQRGEAFPELWDQNPSALVNLLLNSHCSPVHTFAAKALGENTAFCQELETSTLAALLQSHYEMTAQLGLDLAIARYDAKQPNIALIHACFNAEYEAARQQALRWIQDNPRILKADLNLFAAILCSRHEDTRSAIAAKIDTLLLTGKDKTDLIDHCIELLSDKAITQDSNYLHAVMQLLEAHFKPELEKLEIDVAVNLIRDKNHKLKLLGALLLNINKASMSEIPDDVLVTLNQSGDDDLQAMAVTLLGKYSDRELIDKTPLLLSYCIAKQASVRRAVQGVIGKVAKHRSEFAADILDQLIPHFFKREPHEGVHEDLLILAEQQLHSALPCMDSSLRWRLLHAQSKAAQALGAMSLLALPKNGDDSYSVKQWAALANHSTQGVRAWAMDAYNDNPTLIKQQAPDALRMLNSQWEDSRHFGIEFFRREFSAGEWNSSLIIGLCDNTKDDVQRFGRELITQFFEEGDGPQYLIQLSQHPSRNVQLFITHYLSLYACDNLTRLQQLRPYFITVLTNIYKGRIAKDRVITFLLAEALKTHEAACFVADIFDRQSATLSITDKASYIEGMREIQVRYPDITLPIKTNTLPIKGKGANTVTSDQDSIQGPHHAV